jgi:hypothetical protein
VVSYLGQNMAIEPFAPLHHIRSAGFFAAVTIAGPSSNQPLIEHCKIECSGRDAIHISGSTGPVIRDCEITGNRRRCIYIKLLC